MSSERSDDPDWSDVIDDAVKAGTAQVRTQIPGRVLAYDNSEQRARVQPVIRSSRKDPDSGERTTYLPKPISNCPVKYPHGKDGDISITWPLQKGDKVTLLFCSRSIDEWLSGGGTDVEPSDTRRHDLSDVLVDPTGPRPFNDTLDTKAVDEAALVFRSLEKILMRADQNIEMDTAQKIIEKASEIHLGSQNPGDWVALASLVKQELEDLKSTIDNFVSTYNSHQHTQPQPMMPGAAAPTPGTANSTGYGASKHGTVDDVKSSKVKSE
ncbi:MAG: Gp138 family membrane-puncturing spike protein [Bradymonadaceae bacterium]